MGILDDFKAAYEESQATQNNDLPEGAAPMTEAEKESYIQELKKQRDAIAEFDDTPAPQPMTAEDAVAEFRKTHPKVEEKDLAIGTMPVKPVLKRAFCPQCHKEIISAAPVMFNPFTFEKLAPYKCECGWHADLDYAYPRVVFVDNDNNEFEAYTK